MKEIKDFAACVRKQHYLKTYFLKHSNRNIHTYIHTLFDKYQIK